jgi:16S rRNA processing protein RimM
MTDGGERRIALAAVAGALGVKGEVRLKLFSDSAESLAAHQKLYVGGAVRRLLAVRDGGKAAVARFEGIADRGAAEALRGSLVEVDRSALPPLEEGEYYHADLIGLPCEDGDGGALGTVVAVENFGAGDLLEVELDGG